MRVAAVVLLAAALPAVAAGAAPARSVSTPGLVTALAFDGPRVVSAEGRSRYDCNRVRVWNVVTGKVTRLGRPFGCIETSTGTGVPAVSVAAGRVLWIYFGGGNIREWFLFTATERAPKARRLAFVARDVDEPPPVVIGPADSGRSGALLPYAVDRTVVVLRADGTSRFTWVAPARVVAVSALAEPEGEVAVAQEDGIVTVLDTGGRVLREEDYSGEIAAVRLTPTGTIVQHGRTLELRDGDSVWLATLPAGAVLADVALGSDAVYVQGRQVRARRLRGTGDVLLARGTLAATQGRWLASARDRTVAIRRR